jgi:hypothetical protein
LKNYFQYKLKITGIPRIWDLVLPKIFLIFFEGNIRYQIFQKFFDRKLGLWTGKKQKKFFLNFILVPVKKNLLIRIYLKCFQIRIYQNHAIKIALCLCPLFQIHVYWIDLKNRN